MYVHPRALSLRYLVSGYERGRVFLAGVGPDPPSRDAANWLSSRFSRSVETRRRYGWLRMVFTGCASSELQLGALREVMARRRRRRYCRGGKPGLSGEYARDSARVEGSSIIDELGEC